MFRGSVYLDINPKRYDGGDTNKNETKMTSIRRKVGKTKVVSTISAVACAPNP